MADNVQWIRLKVGMFDGNSFKRIKRAKIGGVSYRDKLTAVWFELLDLAGKSNANGYLIDNNEIPYHSFEDIAVMLDRDEKEIELCMGFFIAEKMVEIIDDTYLLTNFMQYQNQAGLEKIREQNRERQARFREKKRQEALGCGEANNAENNSTDNVTSRYTLRETPESNAVSVTDNVTSRNSSNSISYIDNNSNNNHDILDYKKLLEIVKEECKAIYLRHSKQVDERGNLQLVRQVTALLEDLQGQYNYEQLREVFRHANKTYIVSPQYNTLDIAWVLKNIRKVLETEETDLSNDGGGGEDKPKGFWDDKLNKLGRKD